MLIGKMTGCAFSIAPIEELSYLTLTLIITEGQSSNILQRPATLDSLMNQIDAVVVDRGTNQSVNGSLCLISNLEVYRARDKITEIESDGFSLGEMGFFEASLNIHIIRFMF